MHFHAGREPVGTGSSSVSYERTMEDSRFYSLPKLPYDHTAMASYLPRACNPDPDTGGNLRANTTLGHNAQGEIMKETTQELLKKFKQDYGVYVDATNALTYWVIHARIPKKTVEGFHHLHLGKKYVSGPGQDGNVLVMRDPFVSDAYSVESWGLMETFDDFVKKALARILSDKGEADKGQEEGCGTACG